jgi:hypothetical protein
MEEEPEPNYFGNANPEFDPLENDFLLGQEAVTERYVS